MPFAAKPEFSLEKLTDPELRTYSPMPVEPAGLIGKWARFTLEGVIPTSAPYH